MNDIPTHGNLLQRLALESTRSFFAKGEFIPFFQPQLVLRTCQLTGFEVLARWKHADFGLLSPDKFIPLAEEHGWIDAMTEQVLGKAFAAAGSLPDPLTLSINVSPIQLRDTRLPHLILKAAEGANFPLNRMVLEITGPALNDPRSLTQAVAQEFKAMGCALAFDGCNAADSTLRSLQSLPFDLLKIDRSLVGLIAERPESCRLFTEIVRLGQRLGLTLVAEGIETQEQSELAAQTGCEQGQGWLFGKPQPIEDLAAMVSAIQKHTPCEPSLDVSPARKEVIVANASPSVPLRTA